MAKNWKKLLPTKPKSEIVLKESLQDLLQLDDTIKSLIKERKNLEQQMKTLSGDSDTETKPGGKTFDQPIDSFETKRKRDQKRFKLKRLLEEKIAAKKLESKHWENQRNALKTKVTQALKVIERVKTQKDNFLKDDFEAKWQEKRDAFRDKITKKPKDIWSKKRDEQKKSIVSKVKVPIIKKIAKKIERKPKIKKVKDEWETIRDKNKEAQKLKAKGEKKWDTIQKKLMVDSFDVVPKESKNELKQFEDDFRRSAQKEKDDFEEKQQKLKDKLKGRVTKTKKSSTSKNKKKQGIQKDKQKDKQKEKQKEEIKRKERADKKKEENRKQRQIQSREEKKKERDREQKREERREERKNSKKDKYA